MNRVESCLQRECVKYFRLFYPELSPNYFAVPNGGLRSKTEAAILKMEGVLAGVADTILLYPSLGYHGLCIEFKLEIPKMRQMPKTGTHKVTIYKTKQTEHQRKWQQHIEKYGYAYFVIRSIAEFEQLIKEYLGKNKGEPVFFKDKLKQE